MICLEGYLTNSTGLSLRMAVAPVSTNDDISKLLLSSVDKEDQERWPLICVVDSQEILNTSFHWGLI